MKRRTFVTTCAAIGASQLKLAEVHAQNKTADPPIAVFAKPLQSMTFEELGRRLSVIGVQCIEATLRKGGQLEPEQFATELPRLCDALARHDQRVIIAASAIKQANTESEHQLELFAKNGIRYIRTAYYRYDFAQPILPQLDAFAAEARGLAQLCKSYGITALYQNHAGSAYVGAALWDLLQLLDGIDPQSLAVAFDVRHASLELSQSWKAAFLAIRPQIGAVFVKDVSWVANQPENVPLGEGIAKPIWDAVKKTGVSFPVSLHVEYIDHREDALLESRWEAVARDAAVLRTWLRTKE